MFDTLLSQIFPRGDLNLGADPRMRIQFQPTYQPDPDFVKLVEETQKIAFNYDTVGQGLSDLTISMPPSAPQAETAKKVAKKVIITITKPAASPAAAPTVAVSPIDTASKIAEKAALEGLVPSPTTTTSVLTASPESAPLVTEIAKTTQAIGTKAINTTIATPAGLVVTTQPVAMPAELGFSLAPTSPQGASEAIRTAALSTPTVPMPVSDIAAAAQVNGTPAIPSSSFSLLQFGNLANTAKKAAKGLLPLIPQILYELYRSEIKVLQNINVNILATSTPKTYKVGFGNDNGEEAHIEFSVVAGKFYRQETPVVKEDFVKPIFRATNLLSYIPLLNRFEWKRQIRHTDCNIYIDDPGNLSLKDGPISVYYPLSEDEGFNFIYRDPLKINPSSDNEKMFDNHREAESSEYRYFYSASVNIREPLYASERTETFPLPFHEDRNHPEYHYLTVTQSR